MSGNNIKARRLKKDVLTSIKTDKMVEANKLKESGKEKFSREEYRMSTADFKVNDKNDNLVIKNNKPLKSREVRGKKIRTNEIEDTRQVNEQKVDKTEEKIDREIESEDNLSIAVMIAILVGCFVVGTILGYVLYRLAINSSAFIMGVKSIFF